METISRYVFPLILKTTLSFPTTLAFLYCCFRSFEFFQSEFFASWYQERKEASESAYSGFSQNSRKVLNAIILMTQRYKFIDLLPKLGSSCSLFYFNRYIFPGRLTINPLNSIPSSNAETLLIGNLVSMVISSTKRSPPFNKSASFCSSGLNSTNSEV